MTVARLIGRSLRPRRGRVHQEVPVRIGDRLPRGIHDVPVEYGNYSYPSGREAMANYCKNNPIPTAVICGNDPMAIGVIDEARENLGLKVPEDLSVVGFDGVRASRWHSYQLTTIRQPLDMMNKAATEILMEKIETPDTPSQLRVWQGELVKGNTVAKARPQ